MSLKKQAISGMIWSYLQQFSSQLIAFLVSIVLARVISPKEFGLIGMIAIFMGIGNVLFDGGFTSSLIRTKEAEQKDYSTVFYFNLVISILFYFILFFTAPFIADFYNEPLLTSIVRVYSLTFVFLAMGTVQNTILTKNMLFKKQMFIALPPLIISSAIGVYMAYSGYGVWSLVISAVINSFINSLILWGTSNWRPTYFYKEKFFEHFNFGYKLTLSGLLDVFFTNIYHIIIGRYYSAALVGYYTRANTLMMLPVGNISGALNKVVFPLFAKIQDDIIQFKQAYKKIMQLVLFIVTPIIVLMAVLAEPLIVFLFTEKWLPVVPIFQIICFTGILYPIHMYNLLVLQVRGRSDLFLKLEVVKKVLISLILIITFFYGFYAILFGQLVFSILALMINTNFAGKELGYSMFSQLKDVFPIFIFGFFMVIATYLVDYILKDNASILRLFGASSFGLFIYVSLALIFKFDSINEIKKLITKQ